MWVSASALSSASPTVPTLRAAPAAASRSVNAVDVYCPASWWHTSPDRSVTGPPSCRRALRRCSMLGLGGSRGDGLGRSLFEGQRDTAAPGSRGAVDRQQRDAPQSASQ